MPYDLNSFKNKTREVEEWLARELSSIRTGRATPVLLDHVMVEVYGVRQPLKHLGSISVEDPKTLRVAPWDRSQQKAIETALGGANLGVGIAADNTGLRLTFPELTSEKRQILIKLAHDKLEAAKISLRQEREKVWQDIQDKTKQGSLPEDDKFRLKSELQKLVDVGNKKLEAQGERKEGEIAK